MLPLCFAQTNEPLVIKRINGNDAAKKHLETLGFVPGSIVTLIVINDGNAIVDVKGTRVALSKQLSEKVMV